MVVHPKKQKNIKPGSTRANEEGDAWIYTSIKRESYLFVAHSVGKWTQQTCREMMEKMFKRVELPFPDNKLQVFSDGNDDYTYVLPEYYAETCMDYGQIIKIKEGGRVVDKVKRVIYGCPGLDDIETTNVENFNSILRERVGRLVRESKCHSKRKSMLVNAIDLIQFHWNFMDPLPMRDTPGMIEGLTDHIWNWDQLLMFHYAP